MRRQDREVKNIEEIEKILSEAMVCRLALFDGEYPYIVPLCFGYDIDGGELVLYFHSAAKGKKIDLIKHNNHAAFEIDNLKEIVRGEIPCTCTAVFESISGSGTVDIINGIEKITGLNSIMKKYGGADKENKYSEQSLNSVVILKLTADEFCCKAHRAE